MNATNNARNEDGGTQIDVLIEVDTILKFLHTYKLSYTYNEWKFAVYLNLP